MQFVLNSNNYLSRKQKEQIHQYRLQLVCARYIPRLSKTN
jgi:hypothetical protein